ncbi:FecR family protein [Parapedobacter soli]|uniref:FecR family protein n=1 Tax=Parapedobacter soli TaxID=416955 RepID=UPI0021C9B30F|nr:FecR family protein [Parapedobacter soli]
MPDRYEYLAYLIAGYLRENLTTAEQTALDAWLSERPENQRFLDEMEDTQHLQHKLQAFYEVDRERLWVLTQSKLSDLGYESAARPIRRIGRWLPYAAALLVGVVAVAWLLLDEQRAQTPRVVDQQIADIAPGGNRATLTLADGRTITLDEARDGIVIGGDEITYNDGIPLAVVEENDEVTLLELSTPKGGTYKITLPDGTQVWLNAASVIKYPTRFSGTERLVELVGEAYFSVTKDAKRPFKVVSAGQAVEVLGTEFNVSAYPDDPEAKTTLVEGKVRLSLSGERSKVAPEKDKYIDLRPGEQGIVFGENLSKTNVDTALYTAWKSGYFYFKQTPFDGMIRQVARWYDIDVSYLGKIPQETFTGKMQRELTLATMLDLLNISDAKFRLEGRRLVIP